MEFQAGVDQVERELVRLGEHGLDTQSWFRAADELLDRAVGFDGSCWQTNDPATALITSHLTLNLPSGGFPSAAYAGGRCCDPTASTPSSGSPSWTARAAGGR
jgi:hypothetical protein